MRRGVGLAHLVAVPRTPIGEPAPHPSTLAKITTWCASVTVDALTAEVAAVGVEAGVIDMGSHSCSGPRSRPERGRRLALHWRSWP